MKLIIDDILVFKTEVESDASAKDMEDTADFFNELSDICKKYSVTHKIHLTESDNICQLYTQKINLSEDDMNILMWKVIGFLFDDPIKLEYVNRDDEFTIRISQKL